MKIVTISEEDIIHGVDGACRECPIALAVNRVLKPHLQASVRFNDMDIIERECKMPVATVMLPAIASDFISKFDTKYERNVCRSATFYINIPIELLA